jgi:hypothetical protein
MARRCARWRIHCEPPSWLRPRREAAPLLPSKFNLARHHIAVKSACEFSSHSISHLCDVPENDFGEKAFSV